MKEISKKLLAVLMAAVMVMGAAPLSGVFAYADSVEEQTVAEIPAETEDSKLADSFNYVDIMTDSMPMAKEASVSHVIKADETLTVEIIAGELTYIEFVPEVDGIYVFTSISGSDTYGYLYDEDYNQIASNDDDGDGNNFLITKVLSAGKSYYLGVRYYSSSTSGSFDVSLTCLENNIENIELGETLTADVSSGNSSYLKFVPETDGIYIFTSYVDLDASIRLYNENLSRIAYKHNSSEGRSFQLANYLYAGNIYYFRAESYSSSESVDVTINKPEDIVINVDDTLTVDLDSGYSPFIKFVPEERGLYVFTLPSNSNACVYLYNEYLGSIIYEYGNDEDENLQIGYYLSEGETYYLSAEGYSDYESIDVTVAKAEDIIIEPGQTLTVDFVSEYTPYVKFVPETDGIYVIKSVCENYTYRYLVDSDFYGITSSCESGEAQMAEFLNAGETYYFYAQDYNGYSDSIEVSLIKSEELAIESGETLTADLISGDSSFISFVPETDGMYVLTMPSESGARARLYNGYLNLITSEYADDGEDSLQLAELLIAGNTYYFRAESYSTYESVDVTLNRAEDIVIEAGDTLTVNIISEKSNYIEFVPEVSGEYSFTSLSESDAYCYLHDEYLNQIAYDYDDGEGDNLQIKRPLVAGETYYFRVSNCSTADSISVSLTKEEDIVIEVDETLTADIDSGYSSYIMFVPEESGEYTFTLPSASGVYVYLYNEYLNSVTSVYDNGTGSDIQLKSVLAEGKTYYLQARYYYDHESIDITVTKSEDVIIEVDETLTAELVSGQTPYIKFVPENDGKYIFTANADDYTYFYLYDAELNQIAYRSGYGEPGFSRILVAGKSYFLYASEYSSDSIEITVTEAENVTIYNIEVDETLTVDVSSDGETYVRFVPETDETYVFRSYSDEDPCCILYNENMNWLTDDYDSGAAENFKLIYHLEAGQTYFYYVNYESYYYDSVSGSIDVKLTKVCNHTVTNGTATCDICGECVLDYDTETGYDGAVRYTYAVINNCDAWVSGTVVIPETIDGYPVEEVSNWAFQYNDNITDIVLPKTVKYFDGLYNVNSLKNISVDAQSEYFTSVDGVLFSKDMETIVSFPEGREETAYNIPTGVKTIGSNAFRDCDKLESIIIPASVENIGSQAFYGCEKLASVTIPEGVESIGYSAFCYCSNLTEVVIPSSVKEIDSQAFADCYKLANVTIPEGVEIIGYDAFSNCDALTEIVIPASVKEIGSDAFEDCDNLESVTIPEGVEIIEYDAFYSCDKLAEIVIPASVKEIGSDAFRNCSSLADITILGNRTIFSSNTFYGTAHYNDSANWDSQEGITLYYIDGYLAGWKYVGETYPTEINIKEGTKVIVDNLFDYSPFTKVTLPEGLEYIGDEAFYASQSLTEINLPAGVTLGERVFAYCYNLATIKAGSGIKGIDTDDLTSTAFLDNEENYENGVLYLSDALLKADPELITGEYTVKEGTTYIGENAFANCLTVTSVSIPSTVECIGEGAFTFCASLASVNLPEGLEYIGDNTFAGCLSLKSINIPSTVTEIGEYAFALNLSLESIDLPEAITEIPECAFMGCINLKNAPINANTVAIDEGAFAACTSLTEINIGAAMEEIGMTSFVGCSSVTKYTVDEANTLFETDSYGALYIWLEEGDIRRRALISYPSASAATSYTMPEDVIIMGIPFVSCVNLETIDIPAGFAVDPMDGEFVSEMAYQLLAISSATMKLDVNSLVELIKTYSGDIVALAHEIYDIVMTLDSDDEAEIVDTINDVINRVSNYILGISDMDVVYERILGLLTEVLEAASLTSFKGFNVSADHPGLFDDEGVLYISGDFDDDAEEEKVLLACPAGKTPESNIFGSSSVNVNIAEGTVYILPGAFLFCNLDKVTIPSTVTGLDMLTFALSNIGELEVPSSVAYIEEMAFLLANISTLTLNNPILFEEFNYDELSFAGLFADEIILPDSLEIIPESAFAGCMTKSYELPPKLEYIEEYAFIANLFLEKIDIPYKTLYIGESAFLGCIKLEEVNFKKQFNNLGINYLNTIGDTAFVLTSVTEFDLPQNLEHIGIFALNPSVGGAVDYIASMLIPVLEEFIAEEGYNIDIGKINQTVSHIASWFTKNTGVTVDSRNKHFKAIDGDLYSYDKTNLIKVRETATGLYEIPSTVMKISGGAFAFTDVRDVYIPDSVVTLEGGAFAYSLISEIALGGGIREIPEYAFSDCYCLERVTILPTVVSIGEDAFYDCSDDLTIVGYAYSYAHEYAIENEINFETIDGTGYVSIKAPSEIASEKLPVYGNTLANTNVEVYANGNKVGEAVSEENGYWRTTVEIPEPVNNTVYEITAKIDAGTDKEVESNPVLVTYSTTVPAFESITCYHGSQSRTITMDNIGKVPDYMSFSSYTPFTYEIKLSAYDGSKTLYVVSGSYRIPAVYDAKTDTYIATGYFDDISKSYVPEYVTLELDGCTLANTSFRFPFIIDPSGFIYEAVHSNRVEGATVSIYFKDENGLAQLWNDAFIYGQESSIITGFDGLFKWDVPNGDWQIKAEKEDYETGFSEWLTVPPEHTDVYIGLITKLTPNVKYVNGYSDGVDVTFDQYMDMTTINSDNIVVTDDSGDIIEGSWSPVNPEVSGTDSSVYYATTFKFTSASTLDGNYTVTVENVENYADKAISVPYIGTVTVKQRVETLAAPESITLVYGNEYADSDENKIVLDGGSGAAGMTVNVALKDNFYVESVTTVTFDENGKATIEINPARPGITTISFNLDGTDLVEETEIIVAMPEETRVTGVTLSEESAELQVGAEKHLFANVAPDFATNAAVVWSSSDESVATVDENGVVKGVKVGTSTITATTVDGGFAAECAVNITPASYTVTWIIDGVEQSQTIIAGEEITAPNVPEKDGYEFKGWTPDIPPVMPEENLTFTAIYEEIQVTVNVTGVTLSESSVELLIGAEKQLSASVIPASATNTAVVWSSSDNGIATVDANGLVKGVKAGTATITVATVDGGFTAECTVNVKAAAYTVKWIIDGAEQSQTVAVGEKITAPNAPVKDGYEFKGWTPAIPSSMPANDLTFTAVFEKIAEPDVPDTPDVPSEPVKEDIIIDPSQTTIKYGDAIILNVDTTKIPEGGSVEWTVDNESYFIHSAYGETSYRLDPNKSGTVTVTATIYDAEGNAVSTDTQTMTSKAGFFDKIIAFFKGLFGLTKVITQAFKVVF